MTTWIELLVGTLLIVEAVLIAIAIQPAVGRGMNGLMRLITRN